MASFPEFGHKHKHSDQFAHLENPPRSRLPVLEDGQAALPSNANNFHGGWNAAVDPRTGNAAFSLNTASVLYDNGRARRKLVLSWSGSPVSGGPDSFGLGSHWSWNVGTEHPSTSEVAGHMTTDIVTGDGHSFTMVSDRNDQGKTVWRPLRHKLADVLITGQPGNWTIATATGVREHIQNGYEDWEESHDGHRMYFYYDHHGAHDTTRHLTCICTHPLSPDKYSAHGNDGLAISYGQGTVTVHGLQDITLYSRAGGGIARIGMPALDSKALAHHMGQVFITFEYDQPGNRPWLLRRITYPTGMHTIFLYNGESGSGQMPAGMPAGINGAHLPVVTEEITDSGNAAVPVKHLYYQYGRPGKDEHNYTGYQGNASVVPGRDNLFDRADDYAYRVTVDNGLTRTTTTYNKYHLPLTVIQREDLNQGIVSESDQGYLPWRHTTFSSLPPQYSLAISVGKNLHALSENGTDPAIPAARILQSRRYDRYGRVYWQQDAWGRQFFTSYCPPQGDMHCPATDAGWPDTTRPEKVLMVPARHALSGIRPFQAMTTMETARPVEVVFDYIRFRVKGSDHAGLHFWQVAEKTTASLDPGRVDNLKPGDTLPEPATHEVVTRTRYGYDSNPTSPFYGEMNRLAVFRTTAPIPSINGHFLHLAKAVRPEQASDVARFTVSHHINPTTGTRTVTMAVEGGDTTVRHHARTRMEEGTDLSLGTTVYSLATGLPLASSDTMKTRHTAWKYDRWGRAVSRTVTPADTGKPQTTGWTWLSGHGEEAMITTGPDGNQSKTVYAPGGEVLSTWHRFYKEAGQPLAGEANWIADSRTGYTVTGKPAFHTVYHATDPIGQKPGKRIALTTTYGYDALNRPVWTRTPDGMIQVTVRDDPGLYQIQYAVATGGKDGTLVLAPMFTVTRANLLGKPVASYVLPTSPDASKGDHKIYDSALAKWLAKLDSSMTRPETLHATGSTGLLPLGGEHGLMAFVRKAISQKAWLTHTTTDYDGAGRRVRQTLGNGAVTRWLWQLGDLVAVTAPDGRVIHDRYNVEGKKVARCVQPAGGKACHFLGTRGYDAGGNLLWQADEYGHMIHHTYDADGRETGRQTPDGHHFHWKYSALGMTEADVDGTPYLSITYDPVTWKITDREDRVSHLHYRYDPQTGAPASITHSAPKHLTPMAGIAYPGGTETMALDRYLAPIAFTDIHGNRFTVRHDALGRAVRTQVRLHGSDTVRTLTSTTYDRFGRTATVANGIGLVRTFTYSPEGSLSATTDTMEGKTVLNQDYVHDPDTGNLLKYVRSESGEKASQTFDYDINNNLTDMKCTPSSLCPRDTVIAGSTLTVPPIILAQHYRFDGWNNIVQVDEELQDSHGSKLTKTIQYTYAQKNPQADTPEAYDPHRLLGIRTRWSNARSDTPVQEIRYDAMGRMIRNAEGDYLHYNAFGRQDRFVNVRTGETTRYTYDSSGHQVAEQPFDERGHALQAPLYLYYSGNTITSQSQEDSHGKTHVTTELTGVARSEDGQITQWYLHDYKGDVLNSFNGNGQKVRDSVYSPYGMALDRLDHQIQILPVLSSLGGETLLWQRHRPGFNGQMTDPATGYQFLGGGYRAYNPVYRHFMSRDSFSPFTKINGYGFGDNNPIMNSDPSGHMPKWAGYFVGGLGLAMSVGLGMLMPVVAGEVAGAMSSMFGMTALLTSTFASGVGTISGSLEIASTVHDSDKSLLGANKAFGMINEAMSVALGVMTFGAGLADALIDISWSTVAMVMTSGVSTTASGLHAGAASRISSESVGDSDLDVDSGIYDALNLLNGLSLMFMMTSFFNPVNMVESVPDLEEDALEVSSQVSSCFTGDTKVLAASGKKIRIGKIMPGMQLMSANLPAQKGSDKQQYANRLREADFTYHQDFPYQPAWKNQPVRGCFQINHHGNAFLRCTARIRLVRPVSVVRKWIKEQRERHVVTLFLPDYGMDHINAHLNKIKMVFPQKISGSASGDEKTEMVTGTFMRYSPNVMTYRFINRKTGAISKINATPNHPFYLVNRQRFVPISHVSPKDTLVSGTGGDLHLLCDHPSGGECGSSLGSMPVPVYNLEVGNRHNYYVGDGAILVHNMCELGKKLMKEVPDLIRESSNEEQGGEIRITTIDNLQRAWTALRKIEGSNAECDTCTYLTAGFVSGKSMPIKPLEDMLTLRRPLKAGQKISESDPYFIALTTLFSHFGPYVKGKRGMDIGDAFSHPGDKAIIHSGRHAGVSVWHGGSTFEYYNYEQDDKIGQTTVDFPYMPGEFLCNGSFKLAGFVSL